MRRLNETKTQKYRRVYEKNNENNHLEIVESAKEKSVGINETRNKSVASKTDDRIWVSEQNTYRKRKQYSKKQLIEA